MIDLIASEPQYLAHLAPLWDALPDEIKGPGDAVLVASAGDLYSARRRYRRIAYLEHGIGQSYPSGHGSYPGGKGRDAVSLFLSPNATAAATDQRAYPAARVEVVGDPRLDTLPAREPGPLTICVSFHWPCAVAAPWTGTAFDHFAGVLKVLAEAHHLIGHHHPRWSMFRDRPRRLYAKLGIEVVADFDDVCRRADLYIADNTSTLYEFASTGRPVVVLNAPAWRKNVHLGLRFWSAAGVGLNVDGPADLIPAVEMALTDPPEVRAERERALDIAYGFRTGAAERAAAIVLDWLGASEAVAA